MDCQPPGRVHFSLQNVSVSGSHLTLDFMDIPALSWYDVRNDSRRRRKKQTEVSGLKKLHCKSVFRSYVGATQLVSKSLDPVFGVSKPEFHFVLAFWEVPTPKGRWFFRSHSVEFDPFTKSQLASCNEPESVIWCKFGHMPCKIPHGRNPQTPPIGRQNSWP